MAIYLVFVLLSLLTHTYTQERGGAKIVEVIINGDPKKNLKRLVQNDKDKIQINLGKISDLDKISQQVSNIVKQQTGDGGLSQKIADIVSHVSTLNNPDLQNLKQPPQKQKVQKSKGFRDQTLPGDIYTYTRYNDTVNLSGRTGFSFAPVRQAIPDQNDIGNQQAQFALQQPQQSQNNQGELKEQNDQSLETQSQQQVIDEDFGEGQPEQAQETENTQNSQGDGAEDLSAGTQQEQKQNNKQQGDNGDISSQSSKKKPGIWGLRIISNRLNDELFNRVLKKIEQKYEKP